MMAWTRSFRLGAGALPALALCGWLTWMAAGPIDAATSQLDHPAAQASSPQSPAAQATPKPSAQPPAPAQPRSPAPTPPRATAPARPPNPQADALLGQPPVQFQPPLVDLGMLKPSATANVTVMIQNISDKWLTVKASRASCTCTSFNLAHTTIAPGQAVPMDVSYHAASTMGPKTASVRILFEGYAVIEVPIQAYVGLAVRAEPMYIDALKHDDGTQALSGEFSVFSIDHKPFRVLAVNGKPPAFANFDPAADTPRESYLIKWDFTGYDQTSCKNAAGERLPLSIIVETDHPDAPVFDLEVRHLCNLRKLPTPMDTWAIGEKRVMLGAVKPGEPVEFELLTKWLPKRPHDQPPQVVVSQSPQFTAQVVSVTPDDEGAIVKVRITPAKDAHGLINGVMTVHSNRQSGSVMVIATVR